MKLSYLQDLAGQLQSAGRALAAAEASTSETHPAYADAGMDSFGKYRVELPPVPRAEVVAIARQRVADLKAELASHGIEPEL